MHRFSLKDHWHNLYLAVNVLIWAVLIIILALRARPVFLSTGIIIGVCSMLSVVSCAVLIRPGRRLAGGVAQIIAWAGLILATIILVPTALKLVFVLFIPCAALSLTSFALLGGLGKRLERQLSDAMRK